MYSIRRWLLSIHVQSIRYIVCFPINLLLALICVHTFYTACNFKMKQLEMLKQAQYEMDNHRPVLPKKQMNDGNIEKFADRVCSTSKNVFLVPFFNFLYYFGYSPFKIKFDKDSNKYDIKTHTVQQVSQVYCTFA